MSEVRLVCTHRGSGLDDSTVIEFNIRLRGGDSDYTVYLNRWRSEMRPGDSKVLYAMICRLFTCGTESVRVTPYSLAIAHSAAVPVEAIMELLCTVLRGNGYRAHAVSMVAVREHRSSFRQWLGALILGRN